MNLIIFKPRLIYYMLKSIKTILIIRKNTRIFQTEVLLYDNSKRDNNSYIT